MVGVNSLIWFRFFQWSLSKYIFLPKIQHETEVVIIFFLKSKLERKGSLIETEGIKECQNEEKMEKECSRRDEEGGKENIEKGAVFMNPSKDDIESLLQPAKLELEKKTD